jgi:hypothetical protein
MPLKIYNSFDYNKDNGGKAFRADNGWEPSMVKAFSKWGAESFGTGLFLLKGND